MPSALAIFTDWARGAFRQLLRDLPAAHRDELADVGIEFDCRGLDRCAAGVEAVLQVWEGQSHAQYMSDMTAPETKEYDDEIARFFDLHLGRSR
jgi:hypothetical protein